MCHHNSFLIYDSLLQPTEKRWGTVTHISVLVAMLCTLVLGITGYATFTGFTQGAPGLGEEVMLEPMVHQGWGAGAVSSAGWGLGAASSAGWGGGWCSQ